MRPHGTPGPVPSGNLAIYDNEVTDNSDPRVKVVAPHSKRCDVAPRVQLWDTRGHVWRDAICREGRYGSHRWQEFVCIDPDCTMRVLVRADFLTDAIERAVPQ